PEADEGRRPDRGRRFGALPEEEQAAAGAPGTRWVVRAGRVPRTAGADAGGPGHRRPRPARLHVQPGGADGGLAAPDARGARRLKPSASAAELLEPPARDPPQLPYDLGHLALELVQAFERQGDRANIRRGAHRRGPALGVDQADLAHDPAG